MVIEFHTGIWSIKNARTLIEDIHWNAKKLMHQAAVTNSLVKDLKIYSERLTKRRTTEKEKEALENRLRVLLKEFERFSISKEREEFLVAREAAEVQKRMFEKMRRDIRDELSILLGPSPSIPRATAVSVLDKVRKDIGKVRGDVRKQAEIALEVKRGSASATLQSLRIIAPSEKAAARRQKRRAYRAENELDVIKAIKDRLREDEKSHFIEKIKRDLIKEAHDYEKEIHFVYVNLLYCLLFMSYMEKEFEKLGAVIKRGKEHPDLKKFTQELESNLKRIKDEWNTYMGNLVKVLQQLRFSIAPAEEAKVLARVA